MKKAHAELPGIGVVIIGLNAADYVAECIEAVRRCDYPVDKLDVVYVDGGSEDRSVAIARQCHDVSVIELDHPFPSPGRGRNAGFKATTQPLIQFIDSDSYVHPSWFRSAVPFLGDGIGAVWGGIHERHPDKNWYHRVANLDWGVVAGVSGWITRAGSTKVFGGNVLLRRELLDVTGGYDESLIAGEEADLSYRVRELGWGIQRIDEPMVSHDINTDRFRSYTRRALRSGYAYAQIAVRYCRREEKLFLQRVVRIGVSGVLPAAVLVLGLASGYGLMGLAIAVLMALRNLVTVRSLRIRYKIRTADAVVYALHLSYVVYPQFLGVVRFLLGRMFGRPMRNRTIARPAEAEAKV